MKVWALWQGGASYSASSYYNGDTEVFTSLSAAARALSERARYGSWDVQTFNYADGREENNLTPNADDEQTCMEVFLYDPTEPDEYGVMAGESGPDRIITLSAGGAVKIERV